MRQQTSIHLSLIICLIHVGQSQKDPAHRDYVPSMFPDMYKKTNRREEQSERRYQRLQERRGTRVIQALEEDKREAETENAAREAAQVLREAEEEATRIRLQQAEEQRQWEEERRQLEQTVAQSLINMSQVEVVKDHETL